MKKNKMKKMILVLMVLAVAQDCQNTADGQAAADQNKESSTANSLTFKLNGSAVTLSDIAYTKGGGESFIGKQAGGSYINITTEATLTNGNFDKNSNPVYVLQYNQGGGVSFDSGSGTANVSFTVSTTATEITGTFSGTMRRNDGTIVNVTDGSFRVNK
jgi:hypothetical protein